MRVLITGSNGVVGKEIANLLGKDKKYKLFLLTNKITKIKKKQVKRYYQDLTKPINYNFKIDVIIHCAHKNPLSLSGNSPKKIYQTNMQITKNIINFANKKNIRKFFFLSSTAIYGSIKSKILYEDYKTLNPNLYGKSKILSEKLLCKRNNKFKAICLRIPGVFVSDLTRDQPLIMSIISKIIKNQDLYVYNSKKKFNNIVDPYEIVKFIKGVINTEVQSNVYNFSASKPITFINLINLIKKTFKSKSKIIKQNLGKSTFIISNQKIRKDFKISLSTTEEIISRGCKLILKKL